MNTNELKKVMLDHHDTNRDLANFLEMAESTFSTKLHENGAAFRKCEIKAIADRYNLTAEQIKDIFLQINSRITGIGKKDFGENVENRLM